MLGKRRREMLGAGANGGAGAANSDSPSAASSASAGANDQPPAAQHDDSEGAAHHASKQARLSHPFEDRPAQYSPPSQSANASPSRAPAASRSESTQGHAPAYLDPALAGEGQRSGESAQAQAHGAEQSSSHDPATQQAADAYAYQNGYDAQGYSQAQYAQGYAQAQGYPMGQSEYPNYYPTALVHRTPAYYPPVEEAGPSTYYDPQAAPPVPPVGPGFPIVAATGPVPLPEPSKSRGRGRQSHHLLAAGSGTLLHTAMGIPIGSTKITQEQIQVENQEPLPGDPEHGVAVRCPYPGCNKAFAKNRTYNLKAHLRSHSQVKPFQCLSCARAFTRKHDLERHSRTHTGDKPYICEACGKGYPRSDALRRHWKVEKSCGAMAAQLDLEHRLNEQTAAERQAAYDAQYGRSPVRASGSGSGSRAHAEEEYDEEAEGDDGEGEDGRYDDAQAEPPAYYPQRLPPVPQSHDRYGGHQQQSQPQHYAQHHAQSSAQYGDQASGSGGRYSYSKEREQGPSSSPGAARDGQGQSAAASGSGAGAGHAGSASGAPPHYAS